MNTTQASLDDIRPDTYWTSVNSGHRAVVVLVVKVTANGVLFVEKTKRDSSHRSQLIKRSKAAFLAVYRPGK